MNDVELKALVNSCLKKVRYPNEQTAYEAINRVHKERATELRVYFCSYCLGYHLTSKLKKERKHVEVESTEVNKCAVTR